MPLLVLCVVAGVVGILIGGVGIGGVLLPPSLTWVAGMDPHTAAGTSSWAFVFTGIAGTAVFARHRSMSWRVAVLLTLGAVPAAILGSWSNGVLPDKYALLPLAALVTAAGAYQLYRLTLRSAVRRREEGVASGLAAIQPNLALLVVVGVGAGYASALTGTGGPVFLVPALLMLRTPPLTAIAVSQVVQLPLVTSSVIGYATQNAIDWGSGALIGVIACVGVVFGSSIAKRLSGRILSRVAGIALIIFGVFLLSSSF